MNKNEQNYVIPTVVEESHDGLVPVVEISRFRCASLEMTSKCNRKMALRSTLLRDVAICRNQTEVYLESISKNTPLTPL